MGVGNLGDCGDPPGVQTGAVDVPGQHERRLRRSVRRDRWCSGAGRGHRRLPFGQFDQASIARSVSASMVDALGCNLAAADGITARVI
jgi:hypothetical protein